MQNDLISIVVPVYNVEAYIERCVQSLVSQTYSDYEILLINDGSTDSSGEICEKLAKRYNKIKVFHKINGGLGAARNYGIERAEGEFICFVDSDDMVVSNYLETMITEMKKTKADIVICGYIYQTGNKKVYYKNTSKTIEVKEIIPEIAKGNPIYNFAWNKLYKMKYIQKMEKLFEDRHSAEDMYFNCIYYNVINNICIVEQELYTYFVNNSSLSNGRRDNFYYDMKKVYDAFKNLCENKNFDTKYADALMIVLLRNCVSNYFNYKKINYKDYLHYITTLYNNEGCVINNCKIKISIIDNIFYKLFIKKRFLLIYFINRFMKFSKKRMFYLFSFVRRSL